MLMNDGNIEERNSHKCARFLLRQAMSIYFTWAWLIFMTKNWLIILNFEYTSVLRLLKDTKFLHKLRVTKLKP